MSKSVTTARAEFPVELPLEKVTHLVFFGDKTLGDLVRLYIKSGRAGKFAGNNSCCEEAVEDFARWAERRAARQAKEVE